MDQLGLAETGHATTRKKTRREVILEEMELVLPWKALIKVITPFYPAAGRGRRPCRLEAMLRVHLIQNWFALNDPSMDEALYEIASLRSFAGLKLSEPIPDETTVLNFRYSVEEQALAEDILAQVDAHLPRKGLPLKRGSIVDTTIISAPTSTRNADGERDQEMHQTKKEDQWFFGMKANMGVDADSGFVRTVTTTQANESDVAQVADLLHGKEEEVYADSGYHGARKRMNRKDLKWYIAAWLSDIAWIPEGRNKERELKEEHRKASMRSKLEHPFRVIEQQFVLTKVRFRGLEKNTGHLLTKFALSSLWMERRSLLAMMGGVPSDAAQRDREKANPCLRSELDHTFPTPLVFRAPVSRRLLS